MLEAITYDKLIKDLNQKYGDAEEVPIGLLLGNANCDFVKENILSKIDQYHHRSNYNIDFFLPGYGAYWYGHCGPQVTVCNVDGVDWLFSSKLFCQLIEELENRSKWKYSGETELLILNFSKGKLDFSEVMVFWLDKMINEQLIYSTSNFFETIFRIFKRHTSIYRASDKLALKGIGNSIYNILEENFPILELTKNKCFCIYNYEK